METHNDQSTRHTAADDPRNTPHDKTKTNKYHVVVVLVILRDIRDIQVATDRAS